MKTYLPKVAAIKSTWYVIDAAGQRLGKVAELAARTLIGKNRVDYTPHLDLLDGVIVINAEKIELSGAKMTDKIYRRHSGYRGNMKEISAEKMMEKDPARIIELAVSGMLPKNKQRAEKLLRLKIYTETDHPHAAQNPQILTVK